MEDISQIIEKVDSVYKPDVEQYLNLSRETQIWLTGLPPEQEWILGVSQSDAYKAYAKEHGTAYKETRKEEPPTKGQVLLELMQRAHGGLDAMETGELIWGGGKEAIRSVNPSSKESLLEAFRQVNARLVDVVLKTPPDKEIVQRDKQTGEVKRRFTALEALHDIVRHEQKHIDLGRVLLDAAQAMFPSEVSATFKQTPVKTEA